MVDAYNILPVPHSELTYTDAQVFKLFTEENFPSRDRLSPGSDIIPWIILWLSLLADDGKDNGAVNK